MVMQMPNKKYKQKYIIYNKRYYDKNKVKVYEHHIVYVRKKKYGLSIEQFGALRIKQENKCAICHDVFLKTPNVDHIEINGIVKVRGLLCGHCNRAIGLLKDSVDVCLSAANYLKVNQ
jgi:hypothetical protein